jgi:membrane-bound lytic murein transglycosylase A
MAKRYTNIFAVVALVFIIASCYPITVRESKSPLKQVRYLWPKFQDDLDKDSLVLAAERSMTYFDRLGDKNVLYFGPDTFSIEHIRESHKTFLRIIQQNPNNDFLNKELRKKFLLYKATGINSDGKILFTGYYEPIFDGSTECDSVYKYPIYGRPDDLLSIELGLFRSNWAGQRLMGRIKGEKVVPYYERKDIAEGNAFKDKNLEIAWLKDPFDIAVLQTQGSGIIKLTNGEWLHVGYSASNGHTYKSIGKYMIERGYIKREDLTLQAISSFLTDHPDMKRDILNHNPSYVFFEINDGGPIGSINVPLTAGRSLAVDSKLFPKGALVYIKCQRPVIGNDGHIKDWVQFSRFLFNQDTGGAIKGPGRADIFWGNGFEAEITASHMKHFGEMYFLVMKPDS